MLLLHTQSDSQTHTQTYTHAHAHMHIRKRTTLRKESVALMTAMSAATVAHSVGARHDASAVPHSVMTRQPSGAPRVDW